MRRMGAFAMDLDKRFERYGELQSYRSEMDQRVAQVLSEGAEAICYKPFDVRALLDVLERLVGTRDEGAGDDNVPH
jgi:hypothetical protein